MSIQTLVRIVQANASNTMMAQAFRHALGMPQHIRHGDTSAILDRYANTRALMMQRHGVRLWARLSNRV